MSRLDIRQIPRSHTEPDYPYSNLSRTHFNVDISSLLSGPDSRGSVSPPASEQQQTITPPSQASARQRTAHGSRAIAPAGSRPPRGSMQTPGNDQPAKRQSKWSAEEDTIIIELRGKGMKWEDISTNLPGRSAISCRLHYQNYLERRSEWDEQRKDKLAQLYDRFKSKMWAELAEELQVPWRAAEAMHWQLGELDIARRAGTTPFTLAAVNAEMSVANRRGSPSRGQLPHAHSHLQSQRHSSVPRDMGAPTPRTVYARSHPAPPGRTETLHLMPSRRDTAAPPPRPAEHADMTYPPGPSIAPLHYQEQPEGRPGRQLPSIAELTTGMDAYRGPYGGGHAGPQAPHHGPEHAYATTPGLAYAEPARNNGKRPASPDESYNVDSSSSRRRMD